MRSGRLTRILLLLFLALPHTARAERLNVVLIMADDLGYGDLACYGHPKLKTPRLDAMARDGLRLTNFYAGATVCTPSRIALLTGSYPARFGWQRGVIGYLMPPGAALSSAAVTIAEVFHANGYRTGLVGKWHLGDEAPCLPHQQGFEAAFYLKRSNNQTDELWRNDELVEKPFDNRRLTETFTREAIRFVKRNRNEPYFLYVPYSAPHFPVEPHPDWQGRSECGPYGDVVEELDGRIGMLLDTLEELQIAHRTLLIFLSDNGPEPMTRSSSAAPLRGRKWSALEGGHRVPCIVCLPGRIPAGRQCDRVLAAIDFYPMLVTACRLQALPRPDVPVDGIDAWPTLTAGCPPTDTPRDLLFWHGTDGFQAIRRGKWKLFLDGRHARLPGHKSVSPVLFDLDRDPGESTDVSQDHSNIVAQLRRLAERRLADIQQMSLPLTHPEPRGPRRATAPASAAPALTE